MGVHKTQSPKVLVGSLTVLIVDDAYYSRKIVRTLLSAIGVTKIVEAEDGASGLAAIQAHNPDIVLLDWEMPGMNGADFMRRVRSRRRSYIRRCRSSWSAVTARNRA